MAVKLAERTKKARIGIAVMVVPFYHPLRLAEEIGMADQLTDGRLDLGVGEGISPMSSTGSGCLSRRTSSGSTSTWRS